MNLLGWHYTAAGLDSHLGAGHIVPEAADHIVPAGVVHIVPEGVVHIDLEEAVHTGPEEAAGHTGLEEVVGRTEQVAERRIDLVGVVRHTGRVAEAPRIAAVAHIAAEEEHRIVEEVERHTVAVVHIAAEEGHRIGVDHTAVGRIAGEVEHRIAAGQLEARTLQARPLHGQIFHPSCRMTSQ